MRLQGSYKEYKEIEAGKVTPGTILAWNFGYTSEVLAIEPAGAKSVNITTKNENGVIYKSRYLSTRVLALA